MPIYEYSCPDCGHDFEVLQKFSDDPVRDCPSCKAGNVKKRISATSFVLKGGGWYKDHYGLKSGGSDKGGSESKSSGESSSSSSSSAGSASSSGGSSTGGTSSGGSPSSSPSPAPAK